jgi:NTE family protein
MLAKECALTRNSVPGADGTSPEIVLVLAGGNALGSYHASVYEVMEVRGVQPDWIVGASVGAITGAILAGNPQERCQERLRQYWQEAAQTSFWPVPSDRGRLREFYNAAHILNAAAFGRPGIYRPRFPGAWSTLPWMPNDRWTAS